MKLNKEDKNCWWYFDAKNKMIRTHLTDVIGNDDKIDAIERTWDAYYAYGDDELIQGLVDCMEPKFNLLDGKYIQFHRYPTRDTKGISRDHVIYALMAYRQKMLNDGEPIELIHKAMDAITSKIRFMVSDITTMNLKTWLWFKSISGKKIGKLYLPYTYLDININSLWNRLLNKLFKFGPEIHQDDFVSMRGEDRGKWLKFKVGLFYPVYAMKLTAVQLSTIENNKLADKCRASLGKMLPKYNYALKLLCGVPVSKAEVDSYKSMIGDRWSGILNTWMNDRWMQIMPEQYTGCNEVDKDYLKKLYEVYGKRS
jgi:hypothetical protein